MFGRRRSEGEKRSSKQLSEEFRRRYHCMDHLLGLIYALIGMNNFPCFEEPLEPKKGKPKEPKKPIEPKNGKNRGKFEEALRKYNKDYKEYTVKLDSYNRHPKVIKYQRATSVFNELLEEHARLFERAMFEKFRREGKQDQSGAPVGQSSSRKVESTQNIAKPTSAVSFLNQLNLEVKTLSNPSSYSSNSNAQTAATCYSQPQRNNSTQQYPDQPTCSRYSNQQQQIAATYSSQQPLSVNVNHSCQSSMPQSCSSTLIYSPQMSDISSMPESYYSNNQTGTVINSPVQYDQQAQEFSRRSSCLLDEISWVSEDYFTNNTPYPPSEQTSYNNCFASYYQQHHQSFPSVPTQMPTQQIPFQHSARSAPALIPNHQHSQQYPNNSPVPIPNQHNHQHLHSPPIFNLNYQQYPENSPTFSQNQHSQQYPNNSPTFNSNHNHQSPNNLLSPISDINNILRQQHLEDGPLEFQKHQLEEFHELQTCTVDDLDEILQDEPQKQQSTANGAPKNQPQIGCKRGARNGITDDLINRLSTSSCATALQEQNKYKRSNALPHQESQEQAEKNKCKIRRELFLKATQDEEKIRLLLRTISPNGQAPENESLRMMMSGDEFF